MKTKRTILAGRSKYLRDLRPIGLGANAEQLWPPGAQLTGLRYTFLRMETNLPSVGVFALLGLGLVFGLKHATEVDHVVAVSTIVSEHRNVWRSALVGALWGFGHTASLVVVGLLVLVFRVSIPLRVANWLEFGVALVIITLGVLAVGRVLRKRADVHLHRHSHDGQSHVHIHFHEHGTEHADLRSRPAKSHSHAIRQLGFKPILVGAMHGLAGSAALTLLVLTQSQIGTCRLALATSKVSLARDQATWIQTDTGWRNAWPGGISGVDSAGVDAESIRLVGLALLVGVWRWLDSGDVAHVWTNRIALRIERETADKSQLHAPDSGGRGEYRFRTLVCVRAVAGDRWPVTRQKAEGRRQ